jgi:hypothetical protein
MQHASLSAFVLVTAGTLIAACASSDPPDGVAPETQEAPATEPAPKGTGNAEKPPPPPPPECTTVKCSADSDCAAACGTADSKGCCDTATHQCFKSSAAECPQPPAEDDGGTPTSY